MPTAFEHGAAAELPPAAERKRLQLTSAAGASTGMSASTNRRVAAGPDGTRGFALKRADRMPARPRGAAAPAAAPAAEEPPQPPPPQGQAGQDSQWQQQLGNQLYHSVSSIQPDLAGKITGMMLGYYDCTALAELLSSPDRLLDTVEEAVRLLARTADGASGSAPGAEAAAEARDHAPAAAGEGGSAGGSSQEPLAPPPPPASAPAAGGKGAWGGAKGAVSDADVERMIRKRLFDQADWPESYTDGERQRLRSAVRKEMNGDSGHWISAVLLQVREPPSTTLQTITIASHVYTRFIQVTRRQDASTQPPGSGRAKMLQAVYNIKPAEPDGRHAGSDVKPRKAAPPRKQLSAAAGANFGSVQLAPRR